MALKIDTKISGQDAVGQAVTAAKVCEGAPLVAFDEHMYWIIEQRSLIAGPEEGGTEPDYPRGAAGPRGLSFWDLLKWFPVIQAFAAFVNTLGALAPGESATSPEVPFAVPFAGKKLYFTLTARAG